MMLGGKRKRQALSLAAKLEIINKLKLRTNPTYGQPSVPRCPDKRGKGVYVTLLYLHFPAVSIIEGVMTIADTSDLNHRVWYISITHLVPNAGHVHHFVTFMTDSCVC